MSTYKYFNCDSDSKYFKFGYSAVGPILWGYVHWLKVHLEKMGLERIYFFSRDGYIMKQAFEMLDGAEKFDTYYLEVSRRALRVPILYKDPSFNNLLTMLSVGEIISLISIFDAVGLSIEDYDLLLSKYGFNRDSIFYRSSICDNENLSLLYNELLSDIISKSKEEYSLLSQYIKQQKLGGKFAIVDIGWSGGMQRFLIDALREMDIECDIYGFYTGIAPYFKRNIQKGDLHMFGYLFDFKNNPKSEDFRSCFVGLYEMLFLERGGSVQKYTMENDRIISVRSPYEYANSPQLIERIKDVQHGALNFIQCMEKKSQNIDAYSKECLAYNLKHQCTMPTSNAIHLFGNFDFFDEGECTKLAEAKSILYYIFHFKAFKNDFLKSHWKVAFLRKVFLLPVSYYPLYVAAKNILKK